MRSPDFATRAYIIRRVRLRNVGAHDPSWAAFQQRPAFSQAALHLFGWLSRSRCRRSNDNLASISGNEEPGRNEQCCLCRVAARGLTTRWDSRLVSSLERALGTNYAIRYPQMPNEADPDPTAWKETIARNREH